MCVCVYACVCVLVKGEGSRNSHKGDEKRANGHQSKFC